MKASRARQAILILIGLGLASAGGSVTLAQSSQDRPFDPAGGDANRPAPPGEDTVNEPVVPRAVSGDLRVDSTTKGSVLIFPKVELRWKSDGSELIQDTFLDIANDSNEDVEVLIYWVNGDPYTPADAANNERRHRGHSCPHPWRCVFRDGVQTVLPAESPTYWSVAYGGQGVTPFTDLDPGTPPGRPANDGTNTRVMRGYVIVIAVDLDGVPIKHNHLKGDATLVRYDVGLAWEYNAYAYQVVASVSTGDTVPDVLDARQRYATILFDKVHYDANYETLLLDFYRVGSLAFERGPIDDEYYLPVEIFTDLTLLPVDIDLRQDYEKMTTTKAEFEVLDANGDAHFNVWRCITIWDQTMLELYTDANNDFVTLPTDKGFARINGVESDQRCNVDLDGDGADDLDSEDAPLIGVAMKLLVFGYGDEYATAGMNLHGRGSLPNDDRPDVVGKILYDIESIGEPPSDPNTGDPSAASAGSGGLRLIRR